MNTYTNNEPYNPHGFKEQVKIKYEATKAIAGKFLNGTAALIELLSNAEPLDWAGYCALPEVDQLVWELRADTLNQSMFYLMNAKNKNAKKDLCLVYSQENNTAYHPMSNQWLDICQHNIPTTSPLINIEAKREIKEKGMTQNLKIRIVTRVVLLVHTLKILQQMKIPPLLAEELA